MPGVYQLSVDELVREVRESPRSASRRCCCSACRPRKDAVRHARPTPPTASCSRRCGRSRTPSPEMLVVITDVCLCEYTDHGHCGVVEDGAGRLNDATLELLAADGAGPRQAGADVVAPSDMMDGRVGAIRDGARRARLHRRRRSWPTRPSTPPASTARSARPPSRRPQFGDRRALPDGPGQRPRGDARGRARPGRGGRHRHGQAGPGVPRHDPPGARARSTCRWPPTTSAASTRWSRPPPRNGWIDERRDRAGDPDRHQARRART